MATYSAVFVIAKYGYFVEHRLLSRRPVVPPHMYLDRGLAVKVAARCAASADAVWFSTLLQGALLVERQLQNSKNAPPARAGPFPSTKAGR
jgi:hypothetical protein